MKTDNPIKIGISTALASRQFERKSNTWYRDLEETVLVVDLQKSGFGAQHYINLGVFLKEVAERRPNKLPPREHECHIRFRLAPSENLPETMSGLLDLEDASIAPDDREKRVANLIASVAVPFLFQCSTRAGIDEAHRTGLLNGALVHRDVLPRGDVAS